MSRDPGRESQRLPVELSFRYTRHGNVRRYGIALALGVAIAIAQSAGDGAFELILIGVGVGVATYVFYRVMCRYVPTMPDGKVVTVDAGGLSVGRWSLASDRIGEVVEVEAGVAADATHTFDALTFIRCEIDGRRTARMRMIYPFWHDFPAVMVEDLEAADRRRPWWLLSVPDHVDQGEFAAALRAVRAGGVGGDEGGGALHDDRRPEGPGPGGTTSTEGP